MGYVLSLLTVPKRCSPSNNSIGTLVRLFLYPAAFLLFAIPAVLAQQPGNSDLFIATGEVLIVDQHNRLIGEIERRKVSLDFSQIPTTGLERGSHVRVSVDVFGTSTDFVIRRMHEFVPGIVSISGIAADGSLHSIAVSQGETSVLGYMELNGEIYLIQNDSTDQLFIARMDNSVMDVLECAVHDELTPAHSRWEVNQDHGHSAGRATHSRSNPAGEVPFTVRGLTESIWDPVTLDVLVAYTQNASNWSANNEGSIANTIAQAFNLAQLALDNSDISIQLRVVHTHQVDYAESTPPSDNQTPSYWHLYRLTSTDDGYMDEIHDLRDEYGADLVTLFAHVGDVGGIAWILGNLGGAPEIGFSVNRVQQMSSGYTMIHEFGHNFGSHHGRQQTSNAAGPGGGIFPYSTGWRFNAGGAGRATVMHYGLEGDSRIAYFSSPDILFEGVPTGTYTQTHGPADNTRSIREVQRVMASYRPTQIDPPIVSVSESSLHVDISFGEIITREVTISNTGISDLVWDVDFSVPPPAASFVPDTEDSLNLSDTTPPLGRYGNLPPTEDTRDGVIYETSFSSTEGFSTGSHIHVGGWVTSNASIPLGISTANPSQGNQHLRLPANAPVSATGNFYSSYFGPWPAGTYEVSFDYSITQTGGGNYFIWFVDSRNGSVAAGVAMTGTGGFFTYRPLTDGYTGTSHSWTAGTYETVRIRLEPDTQQLLYYVDDVLVAEHELMGRKSLGQIRIQRAQSGTSDQLDLDNIHYSQIEEGLVWLSTDTYAGVTAPGNQSTFTLTFDATQITEPEYHATLVVRSNDPDATVIEIPVTMNVTVSNEGAGAHLVSGLKGNHPNPFTETTRIEYHVAHTGHVRIDVFSVTGQFVRTLVDGVQASGAHSVTFDSVDLASGMYLYRLRTDDTVDTGRMLIVR